MAAINEGNDDYSYASYIVGDIVLGKSIKKGNIKE
jgi:hypothetical protein